MHPTKLWYVKNLDLRKHIQAERLERWMNFSVISSVKRYHEIDLHAIGPNHVYLIQEGHVEILRCSDDGRIETIEVLSPGEIFGQLKPDVGHVPKEFAEAADDVIVCAITKNNFQKLLVQIPQLHFHLVKQIGYRRQEFVQKISDLIFTDASQRIINFLVCCGQSLSAPENHSIIAETTLSTQDISNLTGTSPVTVAIVMEDLQKKRLMDFVKRALVFHDLAGLRNLAAQASS